jgi:8-oxo-dGTP pyrophosphatase MutT (NUDIX family)
MAGIVIVCAPVFVESRKVLLVKHGKDDFWKFCGGRVESFDSSLLATARREAKNELNLDFTLRQNEPFVKYVPFGHIDNGVDYLFVHFLAHRMTEKITQAENIKEFIWAPLDELYQFHKAPNIEPALAYFNYSFR